MDNNTHTPRDDGSCPKCRTKDFHNCHSMHCPMRKEEVMTPPLGNKKENSAHSFTEGYCIPETTDESKYEIFVGKPMDFNFYPDDNNEEYIVTISGEEIFRMKDIHQLVLLQSYIRELYSEIEYFKDRISKMEASINSPVINDFIKGMKIEAEHQTQRWGVEKEENEPPHHYILVTNKLLGKMAIDIWDKNTDKFKHHIIALAAEMFNLHRQIDKKGTVINHYFNGNS